MERFVTMGDIGEHPFSAAEIAAMGNEELASVIRELPEWDSDLLYDLMWRADVEPKSLYYMLDEAAEAARILGVEIE